MSPKIWYCHPILSASMPFQMALDEILFRRMTDKKEPLPIFRGYFASEPWMTTGYSDHGPFPADTKICRRITGGGRVHHGQDLIFSLCAHKDDDESFSSVRISYWKIHEAMKKALEKMGQKPRFYRCDEPLTRGAECFVHPIATDLALNGRKIAGGAQKRSLGVLLHQESIQLPASLDAFEVLNHFKQALAEEFGFSWQNAFCSPEILEQAKKLAEEKYPDLNALPAQFQETGVLAAV